ncbi:hypothetical protein D3C71_1943300 [compost metagenome]
MHHRFLPELSIDTLLLEPDEERPLGRRAREIAGIPSAILQEQVLVLLEPQQHDGLPFVRG